MLEAPYSFSLSLTDDYELYNFPEIIFFITNYNKTCIYTKYMIKSKCLKKGNPPHYICMIAGYKI